MFEYVIFLHFFLILVLLGRENVFCDILEPKNAILGYNYKNFKKPKKLGFFQRGRSMVLVKNWPFFHFYILGLISQENLFYNILEKKNAFLSYKKQEVQKFLKIAIFSNGLAHGFSLLLAIFPFFFFQTLQASNMRFTILQNEKMPFQAIETKTSKSRKSED